MEGESVSMSLPRRGGMVIRNTLKMVRNGSETSPKILGKWVQKWPVFNEDRAIGRGFERVSALRFGIVGSAVVHGGGRTDDADDAVEERLQLEVQGGGVDGARQTAGDALHVA